MITGCRDNWRNVNNSAFNICVTAPFTVSLNILAPSDRRRMKHGSLEPPRRDESNGGSFILLWSLDAEIFNETVNGAVTQMLNAELLTFRQLSRHPVIVEGWNYHHSTRLDDAVLTSRVPSFYDYWMPSYLKKRVFFLIFNFVMSKLFRNFGIGLLSFGRQL